MTQHCLHSGVTKQPKPVPISVTTTWTMVNGRTQGHQPSTLRGPGQGVGDKTLCCPGCQKPGFRLCSGTDQQAEIRRPGTPGPLLQHEGLSSQQMGYWERGPALWECFLEEVEKVWTFGLVEGGENSLPSRGTVVRNQWQ